MTEQLFAVPILRIFDEPKALAFYRDFLGFQIDWRHRFEDGTPLYIQISRSGMKLHLSEHHGDCTPGATVFVATTGLADYHRALAGKDYPFNRPGLNPAPWGGMVMEVTDPFANRLRFWEETKTQ